jgi:hydrogenase/urease accessory protein HupE
MRTRILTMLVCLSLSIFTDSYLYADVYQPAYLELKQTGEETYDVLWKVPAKGGNRRLGLYVHFSEEVKVLSPVNATFVSGAYIERSAIGRDSGLAGATITIEGLERFSTDVLVRIQRLDGSSETARLDATSTSFTVQGAARFLDVVNTYLVFGVEHILQGFDHLLFVACLILIAGTWRRILVTITGFTLAHSVTLTLSALEVVQLPVPPIEAAIALSIVFLAREIILNRRDTLTWRFPVAVSASFGLLHGFGFASALREIGLPQTEIPAALAAFNIGVEIGQVLFVTTILLLFMVITKSSNFLKFDSVYWLNKIEIPVAYVVGGITMYWTLERVTAFWV